MKIEVVGNITSLVVDGVEMVKPKTKNLADEFLKHLDEKEYTGVVKTIQEWYYGTMLKLPWCATALSYFANEVGVSEQVGKHENVDKMKDYMAKKKKIEMAKPYGGTYTPKKGDIVFFSKVNKYADCTHVATVIDVKGDKLYWVGGNTSDAISKRVTNLLTDKYVVCYGVIDY